MCGINGIFAYLPPAPEPNRKELLQTRDRMAVRGPDGYGEWWSVDKRCALGHRRLAVIDLSDRALQPMISEDGHLAVTFNGEIYNYPELRAELQARGVHFRTRSDTEVLLHLYAQCGTAMVRKLRGMFAFAIWDNRARALFIVRDPYGIKPLYTANDGWTFRFASQVQALLAEGGVSRDHEPAGLVGFELFGSVPEPFTLFREIRALPAGHFQWIDERGAREPQEYISIQGLLSESERSARLSRDDLNISVRSALAESVRAHLLADVEVGIFLSAGVDSGALLGLMRDGGARDVVAITLAFSEFEGTAEDEVPLAAQVARQYGAKHVARRVTREEFLDELPAIFDAMDQPSIDGLNTWFVAKAAREVGLKVALSGLGGDELVAGYSSFVDVPRWRRRFGPLAAVPGLGRLWAAVAARCVPGLVSAHPKAVGLLEYANSFAGAYLVRRALFLPRELETILPAEVLADGLRRLAPLALLRGSLTPDPSDDVLRVCALECGHYMRNTLLRDADWAGMAHGVEIRTPLVDIRLLAAIAPIMHQLAGGVGKSTLALAPASPLPAAVRERDKTGFSVPTAAWMSRAAAGRWGTATSKGLTSRQWSRHVLATHAQSGWASAA